MKREVFARIIDKVSEETQLSRESILSKNMFLEVVDARHIVVKLLSDSGFYNNEISRLLQISTASVCKILNHFPNRIEHRKMAKIIYKRIVDSL